MTYEKVGNICPSNKALVFIDKRITSPNYRGAHFSQHNRYTMEQIVDTLALLKQYAPEQKLMRIRTTDISKRPENLPEEKIYACFCNAAKMSCGIGTQDAMRKNLFVDLHRMGLICRFDKNKKPIRPFGRYRVVFVALGKAGVQLATAADITAQYFIFSKAIDNLLGGCIANIFGIMEGSKDAPRLLYPIDIHEYMFFISAVGVDFDFGVAIGKAAELIKAYRALSPGQRKAAVEKIKSELKSKKTYGDKTGKRDYHNWKNNAQQVFYLLNQTVYFEEREGKLFSLIDKRKADVGGKKPVLKRSLGQKIKYWEEHKVQKKIGFELHHVVSLAWSESTHHFKLLDDWKNMIYIDGYKHACITQNKNLNVVMSFTGDDMTLSDYSDNKVLLKARKNILYNTAHKKKMLTYNYNLRETQSVEDG